MNQQIYANTETSLPFLENAPTVLDTAIHSSHSLACVVHVRRKEDESVDGRTADQEVVDEQEQGVDDSLNLKREVKAECAKKC